MIGKRVLITGATNGIGKRAALEIAKMGAAIVIVGRDEIKTHKVAIDLKILSGSSNIDFLIADLSSMEEIRRIADEFQEKYQRLDVLLNNAGAIFPAFQASTDGYEMTFALNHFSYFLLSNLLLDVMNLTAHEHGEARIINVSSGAHQSGALSAGLQLDKLRDPSGFSRFNSYGASKLANVLFTYALARRLEETHITVNSVHPGFVKTGFGHNMNGMMAGVVKLMQTIFGRTLDKGAETLVYLATSPEVKGISGKYWMDKAQKPSSDISYDHEQQQRLWDFSAEATGVG